eukprot:1925354-Pyramimonas_sp.AAC.1
MFTPVPVFTAASVVITGLFRQPSFTRASERRVSHPSRLNCAFSSSAGVVLAAWGKPMSQSCGNVCCLELWEEEGVVVEVRSRKLTKWE